MPERLTSDQIRRRFIDFFIERGHTFVPSSPVVPHDDPTLLFTNAGMNQFKPLFLGQADPSGEMASLRRACNSQKCIRAGGKHNDLDDVGKDFYHHTFFEMLGNWSFGDYFKEEAIRWAWELMTEVWGIDADRLYATYFQGAPDSDLAPDDEARDIWLKYLPPDRVLPGGMKDNFWEMGDTGPCGPCSELHYDSRPDEERRATPGRELVNADHEDVIELWNLVFIQFNRTESELRPLPAKHVDTGLGLERITRVIQGKRSNYDTDVFTPLFAKIQAITGAAPYTGELKDSKDIAYRVVADHIRSLVFAITDGADPSNEGRGYVLRRILRRAVRHGRQTLGATGPFLCELAPTLIEQMGEFFPELKKNPQRVIDVIREEEEAFGRTLDRGIALFEDAMYQAVIKKYAAETNQTFLGLGKAEVVHPRELSLPRIHADDYQVMIKFWREGHESENEETFGPAHPNEIIQEIWGRLNGIPTIDAESAFKLHDTFGFPIDLTQIMAEERGLSVDVEGFERLMEEARQRSRAGAGGASSDAVASLTTDAVAALRERNVAPTDATPVYDPELRSINARVLALWDGDRWRSSLSCASDDDSARIALILDRTNHYSDAGGQVGDAGEIGAVGDTAQRAVPPGEFIVEDTRATAGYVLHIGRMKRGELRLGDRVECRLDADRRRRIMANHTGTHLLNFALRETLGDHIDQKGSLVAPDRLRFDFSHSASLKADDAERIEHMVRERIEQDLIVYAAAAPLETARSIAGVRAVFGETYPDPVRVVSIGAPVEDMLASPDDERWRRLSVEFCGGTHLKRTGETEAFTLIDEEAVAKGVRRVVCLTGAAAREAIQTGENLRSRLDAASKLEGDALKSEAQAIQDEVERAALPLADKAALREALGGLQEKVKAVRKQAAAAGRNEAVEAARRIASESAGGVIVGAVPAGSDRQALLAAMDAVRAKHNDAAVMLFSVDDEEAKVSIAANVPDAMIKLGLKAGDWVRAAAGACGGKGGGRPDSAQGGGTQPEKLDEAMDAARDFASQKV